MPTVVSIMGWFLFSFRIKFTSNYEYAWWTVSKGTNGALVDMDITNRI